MNLSRLILCCSRVASTLLVGGCGTRGDLSLGRVGASEGLDAAPPNDSSALTPSVADATASEGDGSVATRPDETSIALSDAAFSETNGCANLPLPSERFDFDGSGAEVVDRMGGPSGALYGGASLTNEGSVALDGDDDYVDLPNGLLSTKTSATILLWTTAVDGPAYWRVLDFGTSSAGEDPAPEVSAVGTTYVALTTETGLDPNGLALFIGHGGASAEDRALTALNLDDQPVALGVVLDGEAARADLYVDGELLATTTLSSPLREIGDVNNWLGRSQYSADPHYPGTYTELRVYDAALTECEVKALTALGPDVIE